MFEQLNGFKLTVRLHIEPRASNNAKIDIQGTGNASLKTVCSSPEFAKRQALPGQVSSLQCWQTNHICRFGHYCDNHGSSVSIDNVFVAIRDLCDQGLTVPQLIGKMTSA